MPSSLQDLLDKNRRELLDLSTRNRLLSIPTQSKIARIIPVQDELSEHVIRLLVDEKKTLSFLPGKNHEAKAGNDLPESTLAIDEDAAELPQPDDELDEATGIAKRHRDSKLQTSLTSEGLQKRLLGFYIDAKTMIEEQGVNILYLACGHLKWFEVGQADTPRYAPLILVPVELSRKSAAERFHLRWREEDLQENLSLGAKLKADFGLELPPLHDEDFNPKNYLDEVKQAIAGIEGWEVIPDAITLGFFSFAKFLMYRDLDANHWPSPELLTEQALVKGLLRDGFNDVEPMLSDETNLDELLSVDQLDHVVDADSSQSLAIEMVRRGRNLVIQGPPGTGKSQSITNIIATALLDGKKVLFVAEKLAALEVVQRRLEREGLGDLCLELHSNKINKRAVIQEIGRAWMLEKPKDVDLEKIVPKLSQTRELLNTHAEDLHERHEPSGLSFFDILGRLMGLKDYRHETDGLDLHNAGTWSAEQVDKRRALAQDLAQRVQVMGLPSRHPWRGTQRESILKIDLDPLALALQSLASVLSETLVIAKNLSEILKIELPRDFSKLKMLIDIGRHIIQAPPLDQQAITHDVWDADLPNLRRLLEQGLQFSKAFETLGARVIETAWDKDFSESRIQLAAKGQSWLRFLSGPYRRAIQALKGVSVGAFPKKFQERLELVDQLIRGHQALQALRADEVLGQSAFGKLWQKEKTDWTQISRILDWVANSPNGEENSIRQKLAALGDPHSIRDTTQKLQEGLSKTFEIFSKIRTELILNFEVAFGVPNLDSVKPQDLLERVASWSQHLEKLSEWVQYFSRAQLAAKLGIVGLLQRLEIGAIAPEDFVACFDRLYLSQLLRELSKLKPALARFDGATQDQRVAEFRVLDRQRMALAKVRVLEQSRRQLPPLHANAGNSAILRSEMERKRGHRPIRRLLKDAGAAVQAIKPVFMMSPLSVAQFLEPGALDFDLLVIDEASQVQPVDALGAIARCRQMVVVGDSRQLPPTRFFASLTSEIPDEETEDEARAADIESVLGLCAARGLPQTLLRWHYRSRHHSLIAVSNCEFYENRLIIIPSPYAASDAMGLKFRHVPEGVFDRGGTATNLIEAQSIARAVIEHARTTPQLSLGVGAFSVKQRQAIVDALELLRRENPDTEPFFAAHATETFFVKNLENIQGDERDVIFISVGYGRDAQGTLTMNFGPLSQEGGERRLNVLISRAKQRCEVFSSLVADDIDLHRAKGRGVQAFKTFLNFAQQGKLATAEDANLETHFYFEAEVRRALEALGHEVHTRVGIAGCFVDLAIVDPKHPGCYLLGIECDGLSYHAARSARDRDRLRQAVLEDQGWRVYRLWSVDWFQRPEEKMRKITAAIPRAQSALG